jgi:hypothetical protein
MGSRGLHFSIENIIELLPPLPPDEAHQAQRRNDFSERRERTVSSERPLVRHGYAANALFRGR